MRDPIPLTPIVELYKRLKDSPQEERLAEAEALAGDPARLAECLTASVEQFSSYANIKEGFYPTARVDYDGPSGLGSTRELAALLETGPQIHQVEGDPYLSFRYADRELVLARTTGGATYEDGSRATTGVRADLLLQNVADRRPIIGEVKLATDKDPFVGLVQGLACASQLATESQIARLREHTHGTSWSADPRVHVYVVVGRLPARATYWPDLFDCAAELADGLMARSEVRRSIGGIACLKVEVAGERARLSCLFPPPPRDGAGVERARGPRRAVRNADRALLDQYDL